MFTELIDSLINLKTLETHCNVVFWIMLGAMTFRKSLGIDGWHKWFLLGMEIIMVICQVVIRHFYEKRKDELREYEKENLKNR